MSKAQCRSNAVLASERPNVAESWWLRSSCLDATVPLRPMLVASASFARYGTITLHEPILGTSSLPCTRIPILMSKWIDRRNAVLHSRLHIQRATAPINIPLELIEMTSCIWNAILAAYQRGEHYGHNSQATWMSDLGISKIYQTLRDLSKTRAIWLYQAICYMSSATCAPAWNEFFGDILLQN